MSDDASEPIKIYLDDAEEPFKTAHPPLRFNFTTIHLADGDHTLRVEAANGLAPPTIKKIPFSVRNGVAVTVSGLEKNQTIGGQVELIVNAYAGNTEVDFEPRRAETPQPIPTWAWVLSLGVLAWTLFYVFNPARPPRDAAAHVLDISHHLGEQLYMDTCARCHDEDGTGLRVAGSKTDYLVKKLRDTPNLALAESPYKLLARTVTGTRGSGPISMPAWGPRLTNEEFVAVVNFIRSSWGHDASLIEPRFRRPPRGIQELNEDIQNAMINKRADEMAHCCWPKGMRPQLYRIDGPRWAVGREEVVSEWEGYFEALGTGEVLDFQLTDVRYDYQPETVDRIGSYVFAMGRIFLSTRAQNGVTESDTGRFIRIFRRVKTPGAELAPNAPAGAEPPSQWALLFDFASIRMRVGCDVDGAEPCPPGTVPIPAPVAGDGQIIGYADVQSYFAELGKDVGDAPHEKFWLLPYKEFIKLEFPVSWDDVDDKVPMLVIGNSAESNMIRALTDGKGIQVHTARGKVVGKNIQPMPKGGKMDEKKVRRLAAWIDAGCPELPMQAADLPERGGVPKQPTGSAGAGGVGYKDIQRIFRALNKDPGDAGHERFWDLPYQEFVDLDFPYSWDDAEITIKLLIPGNSAESNLIKALTDGRGITLKAPSGKITTRTLPVMPKGATPIAPADIARIAAWIDAGCPETAGGSAGAPKDAPTDGPKDAPKDGAPAKAPSGGGVGYAEIQGFFRDLKRDPGDSPHEKFWELPHEEFIALEFPYSWDDVEITLKLLIPGNSADSNLLNALTGTRGVLLKMPDGKLVRKKIAVMPKGAAPMTPETIAKIAAWIDAGCPKVAGGAAAEAAGGGAPAKDPAPAAKDPAPAGDPGFPAPAPKK